MNVFVSHASTDAELASAVAVELRRHGYDVWDDQEVFPGDNWAASYAEALQRANALIVLITPDALRSPNVLSDISFAISNRAFKGRVVAVLVGKPEVVDAQDIPWILRRLHVVRMSDASEISDALTSVITALEQAAA